MGGGAGVITGTKSAIDGRTITFRTGRGHGGPVRGLQQEDSELMPELPEVETVCRGLAARLEGRRFRRVIQRRKDLRFPLPARFAARLEGRRVERIARRAKYMLFHLDDGMVVLGHLGMTGRMLVGTAMPEELEAHDHLIFETDDGTVVRFNDARRFGCFDLVSGSKLSKHRLMARK